MYGVFLDPLYSSLHGDPGFQDLRRRMNFPPWTNGDDSLVVRLNPLVARGGTGLREQRAQLLYTLQRAIDVLDRVVEVRAEPEPAGRRTCDPVLRVEPFE